MNCTSLGSAILKIALEAFDALKICMDNWVEVKRTVRLSQEAMGIITNRANIF